MKRSLNAWTVPAEVGFEEMFASLAAAGYDGVELNLDPVGHGNHILSLETTDSEIQNVCAISRQTGVAVSGVSSSMWGMTTLGSPTGEIPAARLMEKQIALGRGLGVDGILVVPGGISERCSIADAWDNARRELQSCRGLIEQAGLKVGVENVWNNFFLSPREMAAFIDEAEMDNLGAYFDVGNVAIFSYPEYWIDILGGRIVKIHVKDFRRTGGNAGYFCNLLEGSVNFGRVVAALRRAGYDGYLTAELDAMPAAPDYLYRATREALDIIIGM